MLVGILKIPFLPLKKFVAMILKCLETILMVSKK